MQQWRRPGWDVVVYGQLAPCNRKSQGKVSLPVPGLYTFWVWIILVNNKWTSWVQGVSGLVLHTPFHASFAMPRVARLPPQPCPAPCLSDRHGSRWIGHGATELDVRVKILGGDSPFHSIQPSVARPALVGLCWLSAGKGPSKEFGTYL